MEKVDILSKENVCPQQPKLMKKAHRNFNSQLWREDMKTAMNLCNWEKVNWLQNNYETMLEV